MLAVLCALLAAPAQATDPAADVAALYRAQVDRQLAVAATDIYLYGRLAEQALARAGVTLTQPQYLLVVDRNPLVQALLLYWWGPSGEFEWLGASPVSTGKPGSFDHFETPLGVYAHSLANPDFRAAGTRNANGIRGYGAKGMRVFDFGWQRAAKGWGNGEVIDMRLQMHATDPDLLETRLGSVQSKGCVRIPATLNRLLDHYGVLDADYNDGDAGRHKPWVLNATREPLPNAGRYLVIVQSDRATRPEWAALPAVRASGH